MGGKETRPGAARSRGHKAATAADAQHPRTQGRPALGPLRPAAHLPSRPAFPGSPPAVVDVAEPDFYYYLASPPGQRLPSDPRFAPGDSSQGQWHLPQVSGPSAWSVTTGSKDVSVDAAGGCGRDRQRAQRAAPAPPHPCLRCAGVARLRHIGSKVAPCSPRGSLAGAGVHD